MIKKIVPIENLIYKSSLKVEELIAHLTSEIETPKHPRSGFNNHHYSKEYIGTIQNNTFEIIRVINYKNSFLPIIKGEIKNDTNGSKINVTMNLAKMVRYFMIIWLSIPILGSIAMSYIFFFTNWLDVKNGFYVVLAPFFMVIIGVALVSVGFKIESSRSIKDLEKILNAKLIQK